MTVLARSSLVDGESETQPKFLMLTYQLRTLRSKIAKLRLSFLVLKALLLNLHCIEVGSKVCFDDDVARSSLVDGESETQPKFLMLTYQLRTLRSKISKLRLSFLVLKALLLNLHCIEVASKVCFDDDVARSSLVDGESCTLAKIPVLTYPMRTLRSSFPSFMPASWS